MIALRPPVTEEPPGKPLLPELVQIEGRGKSFFPDAPGGGKNFPGIVRDKARPVECQRGRLPAVLGAGLDDLRPEAVRRDHRHQVRRRMPLHHPPPVRHGIHLEDRLGADRRRIKEQLGTVQGKRPGGLREPLVPADPDADLPLRCLKNPETGMDLGRDDGENQGYKMLSEIDGLDVIVMGHQHTLSAGVYNGKAYCQPGVDGTHISVIDIDPETREMEVKLISLRDEEMLMDGDICMDLARVEDACQQWLDKPIGTSKIDLRIYNEDKERLEKSQFITFINKVQMDRLNGDISSTSLFKGATGFKKHITLRNIVGSYAFPNTLVKKRISGKVLREYIEKTLEFWDVEDGYIIISQDYLEPIPQHFNYDIFDGIEYAAEISRPKGSRLTKLKRNGVTINDDDEFGIVINNYRAAGGGNYPMLAELEILSEDLTNMVDVIAEYIEEHGEIDFEPVYNVSIKV